MSTTIVCDNGTGFVKCGFAGSNFPTAIFPSMVGRPLLRAEEAASGDGLQGVKDINVGDEAAKWRASLDISYPMVRTPFPTEICHPRERRFAPSESTFSTGRERRD